MTSATTTTAADRRPPHVRVAAVPRFFLDLRRDIVPTLTMLFTQTGSPARLRVPGVVELVFVNRAEDVEQVFLRKQDVYAKGPEYDIPGLGLRQGLVTSRGERWKRDRAMLNPMFARRHLEPFADTMVECTETVLDRWDALTDGARLDVMHEMMVIALQIAAETMFGTELSAEEVERFGKGIFQVLTDMLKVGNSPITWALQALPGIDIHRAAHMHWRARRIARRLREGDEMMGKRIAERRANADAPTDDFLGLLLSARDETTGQPLSSNEIMEQALTFLAAGHETTATAMAWFWHLMSINPDARARMIEEVDTMLCGRRPGFADIDRLPWTQACASETLRIHPPVYLSMRSAQADDNLNGYLVKKGSIVIVLTHLLHRDANVWPDPERFDPTRFLPGAVTNRPKAAYVPFGGGRRICIGSQFAMMEMTLIAALTAQRFLLDAVPGHAVVEEGATTLRPKGGLPMILRRRTDAPPRVSL
jgi:cytochrome P450